MAMTSGVRLDKLMELAITWMDRDKFNRSINFFSFSTSCFNVYKT